MKNYIHTGGKSTLIKETFTPFGISDQKGRECGYRGQIFFISEGTCFDSVAELPEFTSFRELAFNSTLYFQVRTDSTRNGLRFGASTCDFYCETVEEAEKEISRRIKAAKARLKAKAIK